MWKAIWVTDSCYSCETEKSRDTVESSQTYEPTQRRESIFSFCLLVFFCWNLNFFFYNQSKKFSFTLPLNFPWTLERGQLRMLYNQTKKLLKLHRCSLVQSKEESWKKCLCANMLPAGQKKIIMSIFFPHQYISLKSHWDVLARNPGFLAKH